MKCSISQNLRLYGREGTDKHLRARRYYIVNLITAWIQRSKQRLLGNMVGDSAP